MFFQHILRTIGWGLELALEKRPDRGSASPEAPAKEV
jgi:hypothetical protein